MTNTYRDTRGRSLRPLSFTEAVVEGLAEGGGLFVPETIPSLSVQEICTLAALPYAQRAAFLYKAFQVDLPDETIDRLMEETYGEAFDDERICPIRSLDADTHILELWHGPTSAFKDMALQSLPRMFAASAQQLREQGKLDHTFFILVATSGDTGKAALEGFKNLEGVSIGVLYPHGGVSDMQFKQMATQVGENVCVWAVEGNFDDCQTAAKRIFNDEAFNASLMEQQHVALSSANSINWGRLLPQVVYYVSAYAQMVAEGKLAAGDLLDVCVPTGNFGNILAAYYAKRIGTPIGKLICASNENRVLTDFIETGRYDISDRAFVLTPSPSMDILVSSNLERQLFELTGRDTTRIAQWMEDLRTDGCFVVDDATHEAMKDLFAAGSIDNAECLRTIKQVFDEYSYLLDPHTAVGVRVAQLQRTSNPVLIASTAHWAKFGTNVYRALNGIAPDEPLPSDVAELTGCQLNRLIARISGVDNIPERLDGLDDLPIRFREVIGRQPAVIEQHLVDFLS